MLSNWASFSCIGCATGGEKILTTSFPTIGPMARRKSTKRKTQKVQRDLIFQVPSGTHYIDTAQALSMVNRKLFKQGHVFGYEGAEIYFTASGAAVINQVQLQTAGDTWPVHNAHVKGNALWNQMNQLVLEDNPSVEGKWADYKVFLDTAHRAYFFGPGNLIPRDGTGAVYLNGEWNYSTYVLPQHEVDPATGVPIAADETQSHLVGPDVGVAGAWQSIGLVNAYQESRATVQALAPNVPAGMSDSFFNLLTDSGSQEPELADVIEGANDAAPYDLLNYPGGAVNAGNTLVTEEMVATVGSPTGLTGPFIAQCGLIKIINSAFSVTGEPVTAPTLTFRLRLMAGKYKGVAAIPMGQ
uniref:Uncharacterized protein n=1 Tax=uncultured marine virus TaxID=186617 RepID=S4TFD9_9VIRU|nr:hypothetical protein [uncultured marine virus]